MPEYTNHKPGHRLYVSPSVRICGECGNHKSLECFRVEGGVLRTACLACEREHEAEREQASAARAFKKAVTAMSRPTVVSDVHDGPAVRKSLKATLDYLHTVNASEFEVDGAQTFGRMFGEWVYRVLNGKVGDDGKPHSEFLRLKTFTAVHRQMDSLLRHDQQQIDLSKIPDDELGAVVAPVMERWFEDHPDRLVKLISELPDHLRQLAFAQDVGIEWQPTPDPPVDDQGESGDGV